jgi:hypothetical protein
MPRPLVPHAGFGAIAVVNVLNLTGKRRHAARPEWCDVTMGSSASRGWKPTIRAIPHSLHDHSGQCPSGESGQLPGWS